MKLSTVNMTGILWPMADLIEGSPNTILIIYTTRF
nr:hypothetical protein [Borreliella bissettiae]